MVDLVSNMMRAPSLVDRIIGLDLMLPDWLRKSYAFRWIISFFSAIYTFFVLQPIAYAYINGPASLGGWVGMEAADICAELSGFPSTHWLKNEEECIERIRQKFTAITVFVWMTVLLFIGYKTLSTLWYWWVIMPFEIKKEARLAQIRIEVMQEYYLKMEGLHPKGLPFHPLHDFMNVESQKELYNANLQKQIKKG